MKLKSVIFALLFAVNTLFSQTLITEFGEFDQAKAFYISPSYFIYVIDSESNSLLKLDTLGNLLNSTGGYGWDEETFDDPEDVFATTLKVYVADKNNNRIQEFDKDLNYRQQLSANDAKFSDYSFAYPTSCAVSNHGDFFLLDSDNQRVLKYNLSAGFLLEIGNFDSGGFMLNSPSQIAISPDGKIFVLDSDRILVYDQFGLGLAKLPLDFNPTNLNITFNLLTVNNNSQIKVINLNTPQEGFMQIDITNELSDLEVKEAAVLNNYLFVLTQNRILKFSLK